jgi:hypothetical protein
MISLRSNLKFHISLIKDVLSDPFGLVNKYIEIPKFKAIIINIAVSIVLIK